MRVTYDASDGTLAAARFQTDNGATIVTRDLDGDGIVELTFLAPETLPPREYAFGVREFDGRSSVRPYSLVFEVGPPCFDDDADAVGTDDTPADAVDVRPAPTSGAAFVFDSSDASRCHGDTDVRRLFVFAGETVIVSLVADGSPAGMRASIGVGGADLDDPAIVVAGPVGENAGPLTFVSPTSQVLFVTVDAPADTVVTGPYTLTIETQP